MRVYFQNPTQGPLITVSFDSSDGGPLLAFVPAAMSSASADIAATSAAVSGATGTASAVGASAFAYFLSGDSSPRPMPQVQPNPFEGITRFMIRASEVLAESAEQPAPAVDLPGDPTSSTTTDTGATAAPPVDWRALAKADPKAFLQAVYDRLETWKQEIIQRIDRGENVSDVLNWFQRVVAPELEVLLDVYKNEKIPPVYSTVRHDLGNRLDDFISAVEYYLEIGALQKLRKFCDTNSRDINEIMSRLQLTFGGHVQVVNYLRRLHLELAPGSDLNAFLSILENVIRNAEGHPRDGQDFVEVFLRYTKDDRRLVLSDNAAGMDEATVQKIRDGVRIHDGQDVTSGDHGFGWQSIRENCDKLGIKWEIQSKVGEGSTVTLTLPDGFFVSP